MEKVIEECAERILGVLERMGEINVLRLPEQLSERNIIVYQALGWLARDSRISYQQQGTQVYVTAPSRLKQPDCTPPTARRIP